MGRFIKKVKQIDKVKDEASGKVFEFGNQKIIGELGAYPFPLA